MLNGEIVPMGVVVLIVGSVLGSIITRLVLKKEDINVEEKLTTVEKAINAVEPALAVAEEVAPLNPVVNVLEIIKEWSKIAAGNSEQRYHAGDIIKEERVAIAQEIVYCALNVFKIPLDDNKKALIEATIENAVLALGHKDKTEAEKEAEKQALQNQLTQAEKERDELKKTVEQITAAAQAANSNPSTTQELQK